MPTKLKLPASPGVPGLSSPSLHLSRKVPRLKMRHNRPFSIPVLPSIPGVPGLSPTLPKKHLNWNPSNRPSIPTLPLIPGVPALSTGPLIHWEYLWDPSILGGSSIMPKKHLSSNPSNRPSIPTLPSVPGVPGWSSSIPVMSLRALPGWTMPKKLIPSPGVAPNIPHPSQSGVLSQISNLDKQVAPFIRKVLLERQQASICSLPKISGPCRSAFPRLNFDTICCSVKKDSFTLNVPKMYFAFLQVWQKTLLPRSYSILYQPWKKRQSTFRVKESLLTKQQSF